jgi:phosphoribosylglycinamide formyltransferase-1
MSAHLPGLAVLASGRGSNCQAILEAVEAGRLGARVACVLSDREDAEVLGLARDRGVPAWYLPPGRPGARLTAEAEEVWVHRLREQGAEWIALAGFMRILGPTLLGAFPGRVLNIHPSLLPAFPGLDAQGQAFRYGVKIAGCTVHFVDQGVDTGPIVLQAALPVLDGDTEVSLKARILELEHRTYVEALALAFEGCLRLEGRHVIRNS